MERELSFEYDDVGLGESDDEVGDDEQPRGTGKLCLKKVHRKSLFFLVNAFNLANVKE